MVYVWTILGFGCMAAAPAGGMLHYRRGWSLTAAISYCAACLGLGLFILLYLRR